MTQLEVAANRLELQLVTNKSAIMKVMLHCSQLLPHKSAFYAALTCILVNRVPDIASLLVSFIPDRFSKSLALHSRQGWIEFASLLRYLCYLAHYGLVEPASLMALQKELLAEARSCVGDDSLRARRDALLRILLLSLVWGAPALDAFKDDATEILDTIRSLLPSQDIPQRSQALPSQVDYFVDALERINDDWKVREPLFLPPKEAVDQLGGDLPLEAIALPLPNFPSHSPANPYYGPLHRLRILPASVVEKTLGAAERVVLEDVLEALMETLGDQPDRAAKILASLGSDFYPAIVEMVFSALLILPTPPHAPLFYASLITQLCLADASFARPLGRMMNALFNALPSMDAEAALRFAIWFAHHLSNFDFEWKWDKWVPVLSLPKEHPQHLWLRFALERMLRLSYAGRLQGAVHADLVPLVQVPSPAEVPTTFTAVLDAANRKASANDLKAVIETCGGDAVEAVVWAILLRGQKAITHLVVLTERYGAVLQRFVASPEDEMKAIATAFHIWRQSPLHFSLVVEHWLKRTLVSVRGYCLWLQSLPSPDVLQMHVWDLTLSVISRAKKNALHAAFTDDQRMGLFNPLFTALFTLQKTYADDTDVLAALVSWYTVFCRHFAADVQPIVDTLKSSSLDAFGNSQAMQILDECKP